MKNRVAGSQINARRFSSLFEEVRFQGNGLLGTNRVAWTDAEWETKAYLLQYIVREGLPVKIDGAGNVVALWEPCPGRPFVMLGSHVDSVPNGGAYDGALGSVGAIEAVLSLRERGVVPQFNVAVVLFTDEEGVAFGAGLYGSKALAGLWSKELLQGLESDDGAAFEEVARRFDITIDSIMAARWQTPVVAYLELHIEQGPMLERLGFPIGVVTRIAGRRQGRVTMTGQTNHAGTTPMQNRRDALVAAADAVLGMRQHALRFGIVGTVGTIGVEPNVPNVIPGRSHFRYEMRGVNQEILGSAESLWLRSCHSQGLDLNVDNQYFHEPVTMDAMLQEIIMGEAGNMGLSHTKLPSWAVHDAMIMASMTPTAMIFVPSIQGFSHVKDEFTSEEHCLYGVDLLERTLEHLVGKDTSPFAGL